MTIHPGTPTPIRAVVRDDSVAKHTRCADAMLPGYRVNLDNGVLAPPPMGACSRAPKLLVWLVLHSVWVLKNLLVYFSAPQANQNLP